MKNTFAQLQLFAAKIDRRHLQFAFAMFLVVMKIAQAPVDGGGGPF